MAQGEPDEILQAFFEDAAENLDQLEQDLIQLEALAVAAGLDPALLARLLTVLGGLKSGAGFLGLEPVVLLATAGEALLEALQDESVVLTATVMDALLLMTETLKQLVEGHKTGEEEAVPDSEALAEGLLALARNEDTGGIFERAEEGVVPVEKAPAVAMVAPPVAMVAPPVVMAAEKPAVKTGAKAAAKAVAKESLQELAQELVAQAELKAAVKVAKKTGAGTKAPTPEMTVSLTGPLLPRTLKPSARAEQRSGQERRQLSRLAAANESQLVVTQQRLTRVMQGAVKLTEARHALRQRLELPAIQAVLAQMPGAPLLLELIGQINQQAQELQHRVQQLRLQPLKKVFAPLPRLVHELAAARGLDVTLTVEGATTEADTVVVEALGEPVTQLVCQALQGQLETLAERLQAGKPVALNVVVRAFYEGGTLVVQVQDDGAGAAADEQATATAMMGVVAALQGELACRREEGVGTCFSLYLPLPEVSLPALLVRAKDAGFALPLADVAEVIKLTLTPEQLGPAATAMAVKGGALPLVYLASLMALAPTAPQSVPESFIVVLRQGTRAVGLVVDELRGQEAVTVKPLKDWFSHHPAVNGATVGGDSQVSLLLDVAYLLQNFASGKAVPV